jgi:hypothetical protein
MHLVHDNVPAHLRAVVDHMFCHLSQLQSYGLKLSHNSHK